MRNSMSLKGSSHLARYHAEDSLTRLIEDLEASGLVYFDDFFEMSGNWPEWLSLYARGIRGQAT